MMSPFLSGCAPFQVASFSDMRQQRYLKISHRKQPRKVCCVQRDRRDEAGPRLRFRTRNPRRLANPNRHCNRSRCRYLQSTAGRHTRSLRAHSTRDLHPDAGTVYWDEPQSQENGIRFFIRRLDWVMNEIEEKRLGDRDSSTRKRHGEVALRKAPRLLRAAWIFELRFLLQAILWRRSGTESDNWRTTFRISLT